MEDLLACRVCLATGVKLYDMYKYKLKSLFETFSGIQVSPADNYPQYLCTYCSTLILKWAAFRDRCRRSQELMKYAEMKSRLVSTLPCNNKKLTTSQIHSIAVSNHIGLPYIISSGESTNFSNIHIEEPITVFKDEIDSSDEEPLANIVRKNKEKLIEIDIPPLDDGEFNDSVAEDTNGYVVCKCVGDNDLELSNNDIEVVLLTKEEQLKEVLKRKDSYNYINSFYKCDYCYKGFIQDGTYKNHMLRHDPSYGKEICDICQTRWPSRRKLKSHTTIAHERKFICKLCDQVSKSSHKAREHLKWHKGHKFVCNICGATFAKSTSHLTHLRLQHPTKYCCEVCGESFLGEMGLNMHMKKSHRDCENLNKNEKPQFKCSGCDTYFKNMEALQNHTNGYADGVCDSSFCSCFQCGENVPTQDALKEHLKSHEAVVKCDECNRSFAHERSYSIHYQRVHLGIKLKHYKPKDKKKRVAWVCEICGKKCISNAALVNHQRTHTGEKPYQCVECLKSFSICQRLQIHLRTHTGERPFKCTSCPKAFKHKAALNRHDRVHSGAKPYECLYCGRSFSQSNSMKLHVRTVHFKQPAPYRTRRERSTECELIGDCFQQTL